MWKLASVVLGLVLVGLGMSAPVSAASLIICPFGQQACTCPGEGPHCTFTNSCVC